MIQKISKLDSIRAKMKEEGRISYLNKPEHLAAIAEMNEYMRRVRREFRIKDHASRKGAADVVLNA